MSAVDLAGAPVADAHCHGFDVDALLALDPAGWADRITIMGMCFLSSQTVDRRLEGHVHAMTDGTVFAMLARRWMAGYLGCGAEDVPEVRYRRLEEDAASYIAALYADEQVTDLLVDDGFPQPAVDPASMQRVVGSRVHRVARIEPMIEEARAATSSVSDLEDAFRAQMEAAGDDGRCVAYKSVIAYRSGLDVGRPDASDVEASYQRWRSAGWRDGRATSKGVRDHLLGVALDIARRQERPVHIHSGAGDPDVVLSHARPANLGPLLARFSAQPIVLIHAGFPWIDEAAYLACMYPLAYLELSLFLPWVTLGADRIFATALGSVPIPKVLYGSDEASEPEVIWLSARLARAALERVLGDAVARDLLTTQEATAAGRDVLAGNTLRLHGIAAPTGVTSS